MWIIPRKTTKVFNINNWVLISQKYINNNIIILSLETIKIPFKKPQLTCNYNSQKLYQCSDVCNLIN